MADRPYSILSTVLPPGSPHVLSTGITVPSNVWCFTRCPDSWPSPSPLSRSLFFLLLYPINHPIFSALSFITFHILSFPFLYLSLQPYTFLHLGRYPAFICFYLFCSASECPVGHDEGWIRLNFSEGKIKHQSLVTSCKLGQWTQLWSQWQLTQLSWNYFATMTALLPEEKKGRESILSNESPVQTTSRIQNTFKKQPDKIHFRGLPNTGFISQNPHQWNTCEW